MKSRLSEVRRARPLLGTFVEITANGLPENEAHTAIDEALAVIAEVQSRMSFHDPASTLSFVNRHAAHNAVPVDDWTFAVLKCAAEMHRQSGGLFDASVVSPRRTSFADVELLPDRNVRFRDPHLRIDLGGIAKGFAVDRAIEALENRGLSRALVNAGGDLRAFGSPAFPVRIRHPRDPGASLFHFGLTNNAVATSAHYFSADAIRHGRARTPAREIISATVRCASAMHADALTKVVMLAGESALGLLQHFSADAIFVASSGEALCTSAWHAPLDLSS